MDIGQQKFKCVSNLMNSCDHTITTEFEDATNLGHSVQVVAARPVSNFRSSATTVPVS